MGNRGRFTYYSVLLAAFGLMVAACAEGTPGEGGGTVVVDIREGGSDDAGLDVGGGDETGSTTGGDTTGETGETGSTTCNSADDCPGEQICAVDRSGDTVRTVCRSPNPNGGAVGDSCGADAECRSNLCLNGTCTKPCESPMDCDREGWTCDSATVQSQNGSEREINVCQPAPAQSCQSDGDCAGDDKCIAERGTNEITFKCGAPNTGAGSIGSSCSNDGECVHNLCVDGTCTPPCARNENCSGAQDFQCKMKSVDLGMGNSDSASICVPLRPCDEKDQCKVDETCYVKRARTSSAGVCQQPNPGGGSIGEVCQGDAQCAANLCFDSRFRKICSVPCVDNTDCKPKGFRCEKTSIGDGSGGTRKEKICVPAPPKSCEVQSDCPQDRSCAIVVQADGSGLERVCIPDPGGLGSGNACSMNSECNSQLCLNGHCADPCLNRSQCANDQVCSTKNVTKSGQSGTFDVCETLPQEECTTTGSCSNNVRICSRLQSMNNTIKAYCRFPNSSASKQLGDSCSQRSECRSGLCLSDLGSNSPLIGQCSVACRDNSQCATGQICTSLPFQNTDVAVCTKPCLHSGECSSSNTCQFNEDRTSSPYDVDPICMKPPGSTQLGATCTTGADCKSGLCLNTYTFRPTDPNDQQCTPGANQCPSGWGCHQDPTRNNDYFCAEEERACTRVCQNDTHCSGGATDNQLTTCSSDVQLTLSDGSTRSVTACAQQ